MIASVELTLLISYLLIPKIFKGRTLKKYYRIVNYSKEALDKNDISEARKLYAEARKLYADLKTEEKKEVYGELRRLYNKLK